jgi:hypothetical protein
MNLLGSINSVKFLGNPTDHQLLNRLAEKYSDRRQWFRALRRKF